MTVIAKGNTIDAALSKALRKIKNQHLNRALKAIGLYVEGESKKLTPVDFGILINSAGHKVRDKQTDKPFVSIFYTAEYAHYVHEMPDTTNFKKFGAENKFLEKAVNRNTSEIKKLIKIHGKI